MGGHTVCSARFSRSLRYVLTAGCDGKARLWDLRKMSSSETSTQIEPVFTMNVCTHRGLEYTRAAFVGRERYIAVASGGNDLCILDAQNGEYLQGAVPRSHQHHPHQHHNIHNNPVVCLAPHPTEPQFLTGSDGHKLRYCEVLNNPEDWAGMGQRFRQANSIVAGVEQQRAAALGGVGTAAVATAPPVAAV